MLAKYKVCERLVQMDAQMFLDPKSQELHI